MPDILPAMTGMSGMSGMVGASFYPAANLSPDAFYDATRNVYTDGATALASASSQYYSIANNANVSFYNTDWTWCGWFYASNPANTGVLTIKDDATTTNREIGIFCGLTANRASVFYYPDTTELVCSTPISANTYYFVCVTFTASSKRLAISVNAGTEATRTCSASIPNGSYDLSIGRRSADGSFQFDGRLASIGKWNRVFDASEIAAIYNSGIGLTYSQLLTAQKVDLKYWHGFRSQNALIYDSHGSNTLTAYNSPTYAAGPTYELVQASGDPVSKWLDQSVNLVHQYQATGSLRPIFRYWNGTPAVVFQNGQRMVSSLSVAWGPDTTHGVSYRLTSVSGVQGYIGNRITGEMSYASSAGWLVYSDPAGVGVIPTGGSGNDTTSNNYYLYLRNGSATDTIRKNGVDLGLTATAGVIPSTTGVLRLGAESAGTNFLNGYMFNAMYLSRRLSVSETAAMEAWMAGALPPAALGSIWADNGNLWSSMGNPWVGAQP